MNPLVQTTPSARVSEEEPVAADCRVAAEPQTSESALDPDRNISPAYVGAAVEPFSTDVDPLATAMAGLKSLSQPGLDQRKSPREKVPPGRQPCEIKVNGKVLTALLINESEGGFALLVERGVGLKIGKKVELRTGALSSTVRIVYLSKITRPENVSSASKYWFRIGVKKTSRSFFSLFS